GLRMLRRTVDMLITIPYQRLLGAVGKRCPVRDALRMGNEALRHARRDPRPSGQLPHVSTGDDARSAVDASGARTALRHGPPPHLWRTIVQQIERERQIGGDTPPGGG